MAVMQKDFKTFSSFEEAEQDDHDYYSRLSLEERLKICFDIRAMYFSMNNIDLLESSLRSNKTFEIVKL